MSIWIIVAIIVASVTFALVYSLFWDGATFWPFSLSLFVFILGVVLFCLYGANHEDVLVSKETEIQSTQKLQQIIIDEDEKYYLVQNGRMFQFSYIDDSDGGLIAKSVEIEDSKVFYDIKDKGICLIVRKTTETRRNKWAFIKGICRSETVYEYDFYIPDRDSIYYLYEK